MKEKWLWAAAPTVIIAIIVVIVMIIPQKKQNVVANPTTMYVTSNESNDFATHEEKTSLEVVSESVISTENVTTEGAQEEITVDSTIREEVTTKRETTICYETVTKKTEEKTTKEIITKEEETTTFKDNYQPEELKALSQQIFKDFKHQTTNTVWNGDTTAKVMHPDQLLYLNNLGDSWYEGGVSVMQVKNMVLDDCPIKTNEDMYNLTGFYQEFIGNEALFKVIDVDAAKLSFAGKRQEISEKELWDALCDAGESSATANFLYVRACYDKRSDMTYVYYLDCKFQWINNNFVMEGES